LLIRTIFSYRFNNKISLFRADLAVPIRHSYSIETYEPKKMSLNLPAAGDGLRDIMQTLPVYYVIKHSSTTLRCKLDSQSQRIEHKRGGATC